MATITITDLEVHFRVGVPDTERAQRQRLLLTLEMEHDVQTAVEHDDLTATIDYAAVADKIDALGRGQEWKLIEKLASDVADLVLTHYPATAVTVTVKKFPLPQAAQVSVKLARQRPAGNDRQ
ncbi:MAG TPA: dihydroneopterin aldolase [Verrucomicrobiota bacterium]|nr:dihydroneopterin aldolase [Verrucomicrobiota bacterium]HNT16250.1 dihydroneopterin aldolase [Verrucomicrobiota bacterium]